ncbi:comK' [Listeria monocytogenes SHL005]|nr:comK' [Listeria monocytogenes SHL005]
MKKEQISTQFYEVNPHTMIIFPKKSGSIVYSEIYEVDSHYTSKFTPFELIKTSCNFFGSSYEFFFWKKNKRDTKKEHPLKRMSLFLLLYRRNIIYVTNY